MTEVAKNGTVSNTAAEIFESPVGHVAIFTSLVVRDTSGSSQNVRIHLANDGSAAATANIVQTMTLDGDEDRVFGKLQGMRLAQGGKLYLKGSGGTDKTSYFLSARLVPQSRDADAIG